jgi:hypothetical protein
VYHNPGVTNLLFQSSDRRQNEMTEEELVNDFPSLLHMAERGSWPNIKLHGLLSTTKLLDLYGYSGNVRHAIERRHRPESVPLSSPDMLVATVRDQKPMTDDSLRRALPEDMSPEEWYAILNSKTFFWTSEKRLLRLLCARPYRDKVHDVLTVNTKLLIERHQHNIVLCPINSGCTKPFPHWT